MAARRCVPSQSLHFDQSLGTDRRAPFWNSGRPPETALAGNGLPAPSPRVLQMKSPSLCFWLFSSSLLLCDPSCPFFAVLGVEVQIKALTDLKVSLTIGPEFFIAVERTKRVLRLLQPF